MTEPDSSAVSRAWSWRHAIGKSSLPPMTRLVLHTLGLKMDAMGGSCYPPISELVELTGLDKKTVMKHLGIAEQAGWITVAEHGFRGQRWKRNEYVARWPGRDLVGAAASSGEGGGAVPPASEGAEVCEGGGAVPPPCASKVVEMVPEGGGNGSMKVVEQFHQDKILPANSPENSPLPAAATEGKGTRKMDRAKVKAGFISWFDKWPKKRQGNAEYAENTWFSLSDAERAECVRLTPDYLRWLKVDDLPTTASYLKDRSWTAIPERVLAKPEKTHGVVAPFGKLWMGLWLETIARPADMTRIKITTFDERDLAAGKIGRDEILRRKRLEHGWPRVTEMREKARRAEPFVASLALLPLVSGFRQVDRDSDLFAAWAEWHRSRDLPFPDRAPKWVWLPAVDETAGDLVRAVGDAISAFLSTASKGRSDDAA